MRRAVAFPTHQRSEIIISSSQPLRSLISHTRGVAPNSFRLSAFTQVAPEENSSRGISSAWHISGSLHSNSGSFLFVLPTPADSSSFVFVNLTPTDSMRRLNSDSFVLLLSLSYLTRLRLSDSSSCGFVFPVVSSSCLVGSSPSF